MAQTNIYLVGAVTHMGFVFRTKDPDGDLESPETVVENILNGMQAAKICKFSKVSIDLAGLGDEGFEWVVTTKNKNFAKVIWKSIQLLNNVDIYTTATALPV